MFVNSGRRRTGCPSMLTRRNSGVLGRFSDKERQATV
jgi:hypothetical protein